MNNTPAEQDVKPVDIEKMSEDDARKMCALVCEDKAKYAFEIKKHQMAIAELDAAMSKCDLILADIDRKVAGVDYPASPAPQAGDGKPKMGEPVGGKQ